MIRLFLIATAITVLVITTDVFPITVQVWLAWVVVGIGCVYNVGIALYDWCRGNPPRWPRDMTDW